MQKIDTNKKANNLSNVTDTEKRKPFILKVQYDKHLKTVKPTVENIYDQSNISLIKVVSETKKIDIGKNSIAAILH